MNAQKLLPISKLKINTGQINGLPKNPRFIRDERFEKLKKSIQDLPDMLSLREIIVYPQNGHYVTIGGNMRLRAAADIGLKELPCKVLDENTPVETLAEIAIKDNIGFGQDDYDILANEWTDFPLTDWGMEIPEFDVIEDEPQDAEPQIDKAAELNKKWQVKTGDLWLIGEHRLVCGDSTKQNLLLSNGICVTSPPYNAGKTATELKAGKSSKYEDDSDDLTQGDYLTFLCEFTEAALNVCDYAFINIQCLAGNKLAFIGYLNHFADRFADFIIWDKENAQPAMAEKVLNSQFEFIVCLTSGEANRALGTKDFRGTISNVYKAPPQRQNEFASVHSATFPTHLPTFLIQSFTNSGENVYEPFAGSGTTLVACQNLNRKCYAIEISPAYCSVILERMTTAFPALEIKRLSGESIGGELNTDDKKATDQKLTRSKANNA